MVSALLLFSVAFLVIQTISLKHIKVANLRENILVNGVFSGIIGVCLVLYALFSPMTFSPSTVLLGALFGIVFLATVGCYYYAMQTGPLSYTTFFFSASMLIPALAGIFLFKEQPKISTIIGIVLFLIAFYFISVLSASKGGQINKKWIILCFTTFVFNGSLAVIAKLQQTILQGEEVISMMLISFCSAFVFAMIAYFILIQKSKDKIVIKTDIKTIKSSLLLLVGAAVGTGGGNIILTFLTSRLSGAYLFPLVQGGVMVMITLYSLLFLKEKMNKFGIIGICFGVMAIVVINL